MIKVPRLTVVNQVRQKAEAAAAEAVVFLHQAVILRLQSRAALHRVQVIHPRDLLHQAHREDPRAVPKVAAAIAQAAEEAAGKTNGG